MNHTPNYNLSQWAKSDQVQMEDFNADNAKIDAAIKAVANSKAAQSALDALAARVTALENKSRFTKLWELTLTASQSEITIPLTGVNWSQWDKVHLDMKTNNGQQMSMFFNEVNIYDVKFGVSGGNYLAHRITFYPGRRADRLVGARRNNQWVGMDGPFSNLKRIIISNGTIPAGAEFTLWGEE